MAQKNSLSDRLLGIVILGGYAAFLLYAVLRLAGFAAVSAI